MYHDLCIPYTASNSDLQRTLSFLVELSYSVIAISIPPPDAKAKGPPVIPTLPTPPAGLKPLLTRLTLPLLSNNDLPNARLAALSGIYDIVAIRPTSEKTLLLATSAPEVDLISLDLSARWPFHFRPKMFAAAAKRGVYFEICYSAALFDSSSSSAATGPSDKASSRGSASGDLVPATDAATARRNLISNATGLIRALRGGKNVIFSSEARSVLGLRAPMDVVNFGVLLGLSAEKGLEAVRDGPALVVRAAKQRREGWRGVLLDVKVKASGQNLELIEGRGVKRKLGNAEDENSKTIGKSKQLQTPSAQDPPVSKRQMKKQAKQEKKGQPG